MQIYFVYFVFEAQYLMSNGLTHKYLEFGMVDKVENYGFDFLGNEPNADITVPFVPVILVVISPVDLITFACCIATALGAG